MSKLDGLIVSIKLDKIPLKSLVTQAIIRVQTDSGFHSLDRRAYLFLSVIKLSQPNAAFRLVREDGDRFFDLCDRLFILALLRQALGLLYQTRELLVPSILI